MRQTAAFRWLASLVLLHPLATVAVVSVLALASAASLSVLPPATPAAPVAGIGLSGPVGPVQRSCEGVDVLPQDDLQQALLAHPPGTTLCLSAGIHRLTTPLVPREGDSLIGRPGAILSGSRVLSGWRLNGHVWSTTGFLPRTAGSHGECAPSEAACSHTEDVFLDHQRLRRVRSVDEVRGGTVHADYATNTVSIGDDPRLHLVEQAVAPSLVRGTVDNVTVANLILEKAANEAQTGAVESRQTNPPAAGSGWRILNNDVRLNHGVGIGIGGHATVANNAIRHQGQLGFASWGAGSLISNNEIAYNGESGYSGSWEAGGSKSWSTNDETVSHNYVHDNRGPGLWSDGGSTRTTYEYNRIADNSGPGIQHEISYDAVIRYNVVSGNGRVRLGWGWDAGIQIQSSGGHKSIEVAHNVVVGNSNGITVLDSGDREKDEPAPGGPHIVRNIWVHDNVVALFGDERTGAFQDRNSAAIFTTRNVRFEANTYYLDSLDAPHFAWRDSSTGWAHWRAAGAGNDLHGMALVSQGTPDLHRIIATATEALELSAP